LRLACGTLGVDTDFFDRNGSFEKAMSLMSLIRCDETESQKDKVFFGCGAHSDYGALTLLQQDPKVEGLQVALDKNAPREKLAWIPVPPRQVTFVVNCGYALENWINGRFKSNLHRVVSTGGRERISVPFFLQPSASCRVAPIPTCVPEEEKPLFEPVIFGEYIQSKFAASAAMRCS
jgi:isopenicillin N synthase-like dioxygenase